ncbi:hypothetical protein M501DRAFT_466324 [Patellaria atrata CBS 101060]|uniref:Phosphoglucomutase-2 n=1 Tax=Patellaria atrata CBS 101060 TaxID=1346257 RepID=A0A9P4VMH0_9PEZI|nr:hypothetical protein M501DRAFT_466324 [Patellaria atrata CBS 101060]
MERTIEQLAEEWLALDKDPVTREEIHKFLIEGHKTELEKRLRYRIAFGTAGLRARMEAGFSRLNSLTIIQATQGLAEYLLQQEDVDVKHCGIVIGRDARYNSEKFAKLTAAVFIAKGIRVWWYDEPVHTPLVPFGVRELHAAAGIMITASHNPAMDNGYKVYWSNGCQIIPPHDSGIAASIERNLIPVTWDTSEVEDDNLLLESVKGLVEDAYYRAVVHSSQVRGIKTEDADFEFVYTPMHGVGLPFMNKVLELTGLKKNMVVVSEQADPDPDFPTVKFPNPEEKGALDLAIKTADEHSISLIVATDPDADRLAVAEKVSGQWHQISGNQLGALLASHILETYLPEKSRSALVFLASTVSSGMLSSMAKAEGFYYKETLTGFKWLGNVARQLEATGKYTAAFAFEEAIGYMIPGVTHDKDGVSAAAVFLTAVQRWKQHEGVNPWQKLEHLYKKYGHFEDANTYLISPSPDTTNAVFMSIRQLGSPYPTHVGKRRILRWRDLTEGYDSASKDHVPDLPVSKDSQMITCKLEGDVKFTARGSGTEPKIKLYIEGRASSAEEAKDAADEVLADLLKEWFKPEENGLKLA